MTKSHDTLKGAYAPRSYLRCPECGGVFSGAAEGRWRVAREQRTLRCVDHDHHFNVTNAVADLLNPKYREVLEYLEGSQVVKSGAVDEATEWLRRTLVPTAKLAPVRHGDRVLQRLLGEVSGLLACAREMRLSTADVNEVYAILAGRAMAGGYRRHVADPARASMEAVNYEKYEDILLRGVVEQTLAQSEAVGLIELGSGPGRILHQYGSTMSATRHACEVYRRIGPRLYQPHNLKGHERLRLVLGVDFAREMLESASKWLVQDKLGDLVEDGRLAQIRATVRDLPIDFAGPEWSGVTRVACILFQTIGNQLSRELQLRMLESAVRAVGDRGVVFVSAFNGESFPEQGRPYYDSIEGSIGALWAVDERSVLTKRGVFSRWLFPQEFRQLLTDAGMETADVLTEESLATFPDFNAYIDIRSQERYKRRALIGVYARGVNLDLAGLGASPQ
jgi:hypothetical protein